MPCAALLHPSIFSDAQRLLKTNRKLSKVKRCERGGESGALEGGEKDNNFKQ